MITGCNTNVRHTGRLFHVQTEDSGRANPHIISHVYHGGTIIASEKSEYGDRGEVSDADVRELIEQQHGALLARLKGGEFDAAINERLGRPEAAGNGDAAAADSADSTGSGATTGSTTGATTAGATPAGAISGGAQTAPSIEDEAEGASQPAASQPSDDRAFGDTGDAQKPLDEVILEYLVKKARDRSADAGARGPQRRKG